MLQTSTDWQYDQTINVDDYYGFVYLITNLTTGRMYVGRKYLTSKKGKVRVPSNWRKYWGSCKELLKDLQEQGHEAFRREVIHWCQTRSETNYKEIEEQFARNVLSAVAPNGHRAYYNANIMSRYFAAKEGGDSAETRAKKSAAVKKRIAEHGFHITGTTQSEEHIAKGTQSRRDSGGMTRSAAAKQKQSATMSGRTSPKRGTKQSDEARTNMKDAALKREALKRVQRPVEMPVPCGVEGCQRDRKVKASGFCSTHHDRFRKHGDPLVVKTPDRSSPEVRARMSKARQDWWAKQRIAAGLLA